MRMQLCKINEREETGTLTAGGESRGGHCLLRREKKGSSKRETRDPKLVWEWKRGESQTIKRECTKQCMTMITLVGGGRINGKFET